MTGDSTSAAWRHRRILPILAGALALVLSACAPAKPAPAPTGASSSSAAPVADEVSIPETPIGETMRWVLGELNSDEAGSADEWEARLNDDFLAQVSAEELVPLITAMSDAGPYTVTAYDGDDSAAMMTVTTPAGETMDVSASLDGDAQIEALWFGPLTAAREAAASLADVESRLAEFDGEVRWLVVHDGETVSESHATESAPIGSVFKLWVLAALADAIEVGDASWDDTLVVTDDVKSLPSGELQDEPDGTEVSVREAAEKMISISDNTATDLLIDYLGRDEVERAVRDSGHHAPEELTPFLKTQEAFALAFGDDDVLRERWKDGDEAERRAVLADLDAVPFAVDTSSIGDTPMWTDDLEWFASAEDVAAVLTRLAEESDPAIAEILGMNRGIDIDMAAWPTVAFKSGSSPGVLSGAWRVVSPDGSVLIVVVQQASENPQAVSATQAELFALIGDILALEAE